MEFHRYYTTKRESIYYLVAAIGFILLYFFIHYLGSWMILRNLHLARWILKFSPLFEILVVILAAFSLLECFDTRVKPKFLVCSHFLIMGASGVTTIPWNEICSVQIINGKIRVQFEVGSKKSTRKESIKYVMNKDELVEKIKGYCNKYQIEFLRD